MAAAVVAVVRVTPYWTDGQVSLFLGDCREVTGWLSADVLVTDPPYGIKHNRRHGKTRNWTMPTGRPANIDGDQDTTLRDWVLTQWDKPAVVFGAPQLAPPPGTKQVCVYRKPPDSGTHNTHGGFRYDVEAIYLLGPWPVRMGGRSGLIETAARNSGSLNGLGWRYGHPHAKPVDVMETLIGACPPGTIADPFAGSGSTLVAARNLGRHAIGVEIHEPYAEAAAKRLAQGVLVA